MTPRTSIQTVLIPATFTNVVEQGTLVFVDHVLMAVMTCLRHSIDENLRGRWFLEVGFGPCAVPPRTAPLFQTLDEAQQWVLKRVTEAHENEGTLDEAQQWVLKRVTEAHENEGPQLA